KPIVCPTLLALRRIQNRSLRALAVVERREVHVISCPLAHFPQQHSVYPVHDRAIQLARTVKAQPVLIEVGNENVLYLQIAARIQQLNRVVKTLQSSRAEV